MAGRVDALFFFMLGASALIALAVFATILYFAVKYRRRPGNELARPPARSTPFEVTWTTLATVLAMVPFVWGASLYVDEALPPSNALSVYVVARQWMWKAEHDGGQSEINELHVPVGRAVKLTMTSQDVIHSFGVPAFRLKADVLPGRYTTAWFTATQAGQYHLFCDQYCGTDHSLMTGWIYAMDPADYEAWLRAGSAISPVGEGRKLFAQFGCVACHDTGIAPDLAGVFGHPVLLNNGQTVIADENYVRESILSPSAKIVAGYQPIMPSFAGRLSEDQLLQLIAYVKSLGEQSSPPPSTVPGTPGASPPPPQVPTPRAGIVQPLRPTPPTGGRS
jgi:cytochrome c oxidase subunit 2